MLKKSKITALLGLFSLLITIALITTACSDTTEEGDEPAEDEGTITLEFGGGTPSTAISASVVD